MKKKIEVTPSSGNVFADLKVANPEEALAKAELASLIRAVIIDKKLTQEQIATILSLDQPKISALVNGKLTGFSLERLFRFLNALGQDVTIHITPKALTRQKGFLHVKLTQTDTINIGKNK